MSTFPSHVPARHRPVSAAGDEQTDGSDSAHHDLGLLRFPRLPAGSLKEALSTVSRKDRNNPPSNRPRQRPCEVARLQQVIDGASTRLIDSGQVVARLPSTGSSGASHNSQPAERDLRDRRWWCALWTICGPGSPRRQCPPTTIALIDVAVSAVVAVQSVTPDLGLRGGQGNLPSRTPVASGHPDSVLVVSLSAVSVECLGRYSQGRAHGRAGQVGRQSRGCLSGPWR